MELKLLLCTVKILVFHFPSVLHNNCRCFPKWWFATWELFSFYSDKVSCIPLSWPWTSDPPVSASGVCTTTPGLWSAENQTQDVVHARQTLYQLSPFLVKVMCTFSIFASWLFLPISALFLSYLARVDFLFQYPFVTYVWCWPGDKLIAEVNA